jgi:hypothetical protein
MVPTGWTALLPIAARKVAQGADKRRKETNWKPKRKRFGYAPVNALKV